MFNLFRKSHLLTGLALLSLNPLMAWECCDSYECNRSYVGIFGGALYSDSSELSQMGTAFFTEAQGGPLAVLAQGHSKKTTSGFGGIQIGYEWSPQYIGCSDWALAKAVEVEAYWHSHTTKGHLLSPSDRLPEHDFLDSFHVDAGVYLANVVFSLNNRCYAAFSPYIGVGIGATRLSLKHADSLQTDPIEQGINHFNSKRNDSSWAFAAQAKAGLRYNFCESFHVFLEYRYLFVDSSNYIFGSTVSPDHAPTSPWNVKVKDIRYNAFVVGLQYDL